MTSEITNIRVNLQEWTNRMRKAEYSQFGYAFKFFMKNIEENPVISSLLEEAVTTFPINDDDLKKIWENNYLDWNETIEIQDEMHHAAISYQFMHYIFKHLGSNVHQAFLTLTMFTAKRQTSDCIRIFIEPIVYYLHDRLDDSNSTLHLILKYKKRVEWFTRRELLAKYVAAEKSYEQIFEDDLRLFLFDQGIEYPFSTPQSPSGRADVVGALESKDPVVIEIKFLDKNKSYGLNRLQGGVTQAVQYVTDYHKPFGFLVVFNLDETEYDFKLDGDETKTPRIQVGDKTIFLVLINLRDTVSASKQGKLKTISIERKDLIK